MSKINNKNLITFGIIFRMIFSLAILSLFPINTKADVCDIWHEDGREFASCDSYYAENNPTYSGSSNGSNGNYNNNNTYNNNGNDYYGNTINPIPVVYSVSPNMVNKNSNTEITVSGNNFTRNSTVRINDLNLNTSFVNSNTLRAQLSSYNLNANNSNVISVFTPSPGGGYSNAVVINVNNTASNSNVTNSTNSKNNNSASSAKSASEENSTGVDVSTENKGSVKELAANAIFGKNAFMPSSLIQWIFFFILILLGVVLWRKLYVSEEDKNIPLKHA